MTCRCNDLRRELLRLLRAVKRDRFASMCRDRLIGRRGQKTQVAIRRLHPMRRPPLAPTRESFFHSDLRKLCKN
jgi:hypothetical protein